MTIANRITIGRIASAPVIFAVYYFTIVRGWAPVPGIIAVWVLFLVSESSDLVDGYIARKRGEVSDIGKLLDPFADVICRVTYFSLFTAGGLMPVWALVIILYREFTIMFLRMMLVGRGKAMGARPGGKIKSVLYFVASTVGIMTQTVRIFWPELPWLPVFDTAAFVSFVVAAAAALISLADYVVVAVKFLTGADGGNR
jgi:CDP-diacylglycerol--glycerol-3-phosphate 3-phosphatidyltransferase